MMFKLTTVIALVAAFASNTQAAVAGTGSSVEAQPNPQCPVNNTLCGFALIDRCGHDPLELWALNKTVSYSDVWDSIYRVDGTGKPVEFIFECKTGCSTFPDRPQTECN